MNNQLLLAFCGLFLSLQSLSGQQGDSLLLSWEQTMVSSQDPDQRKRAYDSLTLWILETVEEPQGWSADMAGLRSIAVQYPADSSFRILTLQLAESVDSYRHFGLLQFRDMDTIIRLIDSDVRDYSTYYVEARQWEGALYYAMKEVESDEDLRQFVLFGFDSHSGYFHRKVAEILAVDPEKGEAHFVKGSFHLAGGEVKSQIELVYAAEVPIRLHFNDSLGMIVHDHLIPMPSLYEKGRIVMVSDGSYEGFVWNGDYWQHVPKVFNHLSERPPGQGLPEERKRLFKKN